MKVYRWGDVAKENQTMRFEVFSKFLNDQGIKNEYIPQPVTPDQFDESFRKNFDQFDSLRVGSPYGERVVQQFTHLPATMMQLKACDCLIRRNGVWWPENLLALSLNRLLANDIKNLDLRAGALVVGAGAAARATVAACVRLGFNKIGITDQFDERGLELVRDLKKFYFNVQLEFMPENSLTSLPGTYSLVINATPLVDTNTVLKQLYYFNFLKSGGTVVDYVLEPVDTPLLKEALDVGAHVIYGHRVAAYADILWAKMVFDKELDVDDLDQRLAEKIKQTESKPVSQTQA